MNKKSENIKNGNLDFDWKGQFPSVPEQIHRSLVNTLEELPNAPISSNKVRIGKTALWKRVAVLVAALVAVLGTTVAASEIFKWNERTVWYLRNPSEEIQNKFTDLGLTSIEGDSATVEGITVAVEQVVQDENTLYVALKVTAEEPIIGGWGFLKCQYVTDEGETLNLIPGTERCSFYNDSHSSQSHAEEPLTREGYMFYTIHSHVVGKLNYDHLTLRLTDYNYSQYYTPVTAEEKEMFIEGCWELSIPLNPDSAKQLTKVYEVNQEVPMNAEPVTVKEITLTPFTLSIVGEASEDKEKRKEYSEKYDKWYPADGFFGHKSIYGIKYKDGRVVDLSHNTAGLSTSSGVGAKREYYGEFNTIVDTNNVAAILFGENGEISIEVEETP